MTPSYVQLSNISGALTSAKATVELPQTYRYKHLMLRFPGSLASAATLADIVSTITLKINGTPQRTREAYQINRLNMLNSDAVAAPKGIATLADVIAHAGNLVAWTVGSGGLVNGYVGADGYFKNTAGLTTTLPTGSEVWLPYLFAETFRKSTMAGDAMSLPTFDAKGNRLFGSVTLELQLGSKAAASGAMTAEADVDYIPRELSNPASPNEVLLSKWQTYAFTAPASDNEVTINNLPRIPRQAYQALYLFTEGALYGGGLVMTVSSKPAITSSKLKVNNTMVVDGAAKHALDFRNIRNGMNQAGTVLTGYDLILDVDDRVNSALQAGNAQEFVFTPKFGTVGTAGTAQLAYDLYGPVI